MKNKKNKTINNIFKMTLIILFAIFITMFVSNKFGYYEYRKSQQVTLTQEQIKKFEEDVKNGKDVQLENYLQNTTKNYQTPISQIGLNISNSISGIVKKGVDGFFGYINKLVTQNS